MNERLEIEGDMREDFEWWEANEDAPVVERTDADVDAHYLDWCERNGIVPALVPAGMGTDPSGEPVQVWQFA